MPAVWDAVVIGAGPTGCLVAQRLADWGLKPLLMDAGPRPAPRQKIQDVDRRQWPFTVVGDSYDWYRIRAIGGRTHLWGSWCYRFPERVFQRGGWPWGLAELDSHYREAESRLNLRAGKPNTRFAAIAGELELQMLPKVGARSPTDEIWTPLALPLARQARTHHPALSFEHRRGRATALRCFDLRRERVVRVRARAFVLAASPVESARILLCSELGSGAERIGHGLVNHLVASYVLLEPQPPPHEPDPLARSALIESFVNLDEHTARPYPGGFSIELSGPVPLEALDIERMVPASERDGWRATRIHAMGECFPYEQRYVDLDTNQLDMSGRPAPRIHMALSEAEHQLADDMRQSCARLADAMAVPGSKLIKFTDPLTPGSGHEAGTCAMGLEAPAPCTPTGRLRALDNVWVADASTMPTSGDRHPTLTVLAQAMRAAADCRRVAGSR